MKRNRTRKANELIAAAQAFRRELDWLEKADPTESEELFGYTFLKLARIFDQNKER